MDEMVRVSGVADVLGGKTEPNKKKKKLPSPAEKTYKKKRNKMRKAAKTAMLKGKGKR